MKGLETMSISKRLISAVLVGAIGIGSACSPKNEDQAKKVAQEIEDKTKEVAEKAADKTKEVAGDVADKSKEIVSATGEAITDGWITTKVKAKFADEKLLKDSKINVVTNDHVVTLKGTVASDAAKKRAAAIASGTEGVVRVVDQVVVNVR
jgi:osmotically-inducible protein OsmY